jgi:hypothetical protein
METASETGGGSVAKGPPPPWNRRDCSFDHLVAAAAARGSGKVMVYSGIPDLERAHAIRRGIYRCAKHRGVTADAGPAGQLAGGDDMGVRKAGGEYELRYRIWTKGQGRKRLLAKYGSDRSQWPYDPRRPATQDEKDSWANKNERGEPVRHE